MDSTIIQEIANQLGIAADQAGQFIVDYLPQYAAMKMVKPILFVVVMAISIIVLFASCRFYGKKAQKELEEKIEEYKKAEHHYWEMYPDFEDSLYGKIAICAFLALLAEIVIFIVGLFIVSPTIIGWSNYPEAMLIDMAFKAVS